VKRSFRAQLAIRFTATMVIASAAVAAAGYWALRSVLNRQIDASLLSVASIQAVSVTSDPEGEMAFHEWDLTPAEATSLRDLARYVQVWSESGESLLRSRYMTSDLPLDRALLREAAQGPVWREDRYEGQPIRALYYPLGRLGPSHEQHVLEVAAPLVARDRTLEVVRSLLAGVILLVGAGTFAGSWWLGARTMRPIRDIIDQTEDIGAATLGRRIRARAEAAEYERLVRVLNTMVARIDAAFDAQKRFTADASHELRSPLTALRGEIELALRRDRTPAEYRRVLESALEEAERLSEMAENLLTLARSDAGVIQPRLERVDLRARAEEVARRLESRAGDLGVRVDLVGPHPVPVVGDATLLGRLIWNLADNALKFAPRGSRVELALVVSDEEARLTVSDEGPGIPEEDLDRVFERFYRAPGGAHSEGSGLGLSIVRAIAIAHGGEARAENRVGGGAVFSIRIPRNGFGDA